MVKSPVAPPVPDVVAEGAQEALEPAIPEAHRGSFTKETTLDEINGLVINGIGRLLSQFTEHIDDEALYFVATKERHKYGTDKCNHFILLQICGEVS
jgi:hypothetical protein